jgi:DNA polymerase III subunit epsilon
MKLLIIDCETTGLPENNGELIEIAAILFDVPTRSVLAQVSTLLPVKVHGMEECHGITEQMVKTAETMTKYIRGHILDTIKYMQWDAAHAIAHSATFDKQFTSDLIDLPWLCTYEDFRFTPHKPQSLINLALAHGVPVIKAHRALTDCMLIAEILAKRDDLESLIEVAIARSQSPLVEIKALVDYNNRDKASKARFSWDGTKRAWLKTLKECDLDDVVGVDWERV